MDEYDVFLSDAASADISSIADYITFTLREPVIARRQVARLRAAVESLRTMPGRHALIRDAYLASRGLRMIPSDHYLIFYRIDEAAKNVLIIRIVHSKREWSSLFQ